MILQIDDVLSDAELERIHSQLQVASFQDGRATAGSYARTVKHNTQLQKTPESTDELESLLQQSIIRNPLFQSAVRPNVIRPVTISRYEPGMSYGSHTDNALMGKQPKIRTDVSLTLFLSDPDTYQGGELIIDTSLGEQPFKLPAGSMVVYPSLYLHRVAEVTSGVRLAGVTWVQSLIRDPIEREIVFELDTVRKSLFEKYGKTVEFDLLCKNVGNLVRKWVDL